MTWIKVVPFEEAKGRLKRLYERIKGPDNNIDNIMMVHSLRPHTMEGHMALYKNCLHHTANTIPTDFLEALGIYVSMLNNCAYCVEHHFEGLKRLLKDDGKDGSRASKIRQSFASGNPQDAFDGKELAAILYARKLTQNPGAAKQDDVEHLKATGWDDGEILEINQVVAYFAYANRTVLGLGINTDGDILGLSPEDSGNDENWDENWGHQ